jgi:Rap1a immunity proteins
VFLARWQSMPPREAAAKRSRRPRVESCHAVEQSAQSAPGDTIDISPEGLPCWYYMSAVQNMSALVDSKNERLLALCPPAESTTLDFVRAFLRSAERKNEADVNNPAVLVLHALTKAYPCHEPTPAQ